MIGVQPITSIQWSPVRAPRVVPRTHRPISVAAVSRLRELENRERTLKRRNLLRMVGGCAIIATLAGVVVPATVAFFIRRYVETHPVGGVPSIREPVLFIDGLTLPVTFLIACCTARNSRSAEVNEFLKTGTRSNGGNDNPLLRLALMLLMLGFLCGSFLVVDVIGSLLLRFRLRNVDRYRAAVILQMLFREPKGIDPRLLLQFREDPKHLRNTLGYLMAYEWADISAKGDLLTLLSPAARELRHAKAGLYEVSDTQGGEIG